MNLRKEQLIGLPVYTQSGQHLGKVADFEFDSSAHLIRCYFVKSRDIIKGLLQNELSISREQVISISEEKMIVEDSIVSEAEIKKEAMKRPVPAN